MGKINLKDTELISLKDFRLNAQSYIDAVTKGQSFLVLKRSAPVFRMEPVEEKWETVVDLQKINKDGVDAKKILSALE